MLSSRYTLRRSIFIGACGRDGTTSRLYIETGESTPGYGASVLQSLPDPETVSSYDWHDDDGDIFNIQSEVEPQAG